MIMENGELVPDLRFSEFEGNWELNTLKNHKIMVIDGDRGKNYPKSNDFTENGYCLFLNAKNVTSRGFEFFETSFISKEKDALLSKGKLNRNDLVLTTRGTVGNIAFYNDKVDYNHIRINSGMVILRAKEEYIDGLFLSYIFISPNLIKLIKIVAFGSAQPQLTVKEINKFKFCLPSLKEQQKIANFLTAIDQRITLLKEKKAALEDYKKGLMQKIFSQEIRFKPDNNAPLLRGDTGVCSDAPESNMKTQNHENPNEHPPSPPSRAEEVSCSYPDWEEKKLGSIGTFLGGGTPSTAKHKYWQGDIPWVSSSDVEENSVNDLTISRYISKEAIKNSATKIVPKNSLLIVSRVGIGKLAVTKQSICTSQDFSNFTPKDDNAYFLGYLLLFNKNKLLSVAQGTSIKGFTNNDLKSLKLKIPCKEEQQKIANFLSAIDQKINAMDKQIADSELFKKGLLQRMVV